MAWSGEAEVGLAGLKAREAGRGAAGYLVVYLDREFKIVWVNRAYGSLAGMPPEAFAGRRFFDLHPSDRNEALFRRVARTGEPYAARSLRLGPSRREGGVPGIWWDCAVSPAGNGGLLLVLQDVTDRVRLEREEAWQGPEPGAARVAGVHVPPPL